MRLRPPRIATIVRRYLISDFNSVNLLHNTGFSHLINVYRQSVNLIIFFVAFSTFYNHCRSQHVQLMFVSIQIFKKIKAAQTYFGRHKTDYIGLLQMGAVGGCLQLYLCNRAFNTFLANLKTFYVG